ncbi:MAG: PAS domain-containing protein [Anaerolineae bacterium]|nr:PAS domain-containing protein [Anaerolineae bacterium]
MKDARKTKSQLIEELTGARSRIAELEALTEKAVLDQRLLRAFLENVSDKVYFKDAESRFIKVSKSTAEMLGLSDPAAIVGKTDFDLFTEEHARPAFEDEQEVMQTGQSIFKEERETWIDGQETWASTIKMPLRDEEGEIVGTFGVSRDITGQKQIETESARLQQELVDAQQRAIQELSTPVIPVLEGVIVMPLVGSIDTLRARDIMRRLLGGIREHRAKVVILDITGVSIVDSGVASHLNKTIQAARLKGARTIVVGISDAVAETIVDLGLDWSRIETLSDLQTGLRVALQGMGFGLVRLDE